MLFIIPNKLLPDGWGESIKSAQQKLEEMNGELVNEAKAKIAYAVNLDEQGASKGEEQLHRTHVSHRDMIRHPVV